MITPDDFLAAMVAAVKAAFPGETIYTNVKPRDGDRPCNLVELQRIRLGEISGGTVKLLYTYMITDLVTVDARHMSNIEVLDVRTLALVGLFAKGYLKVGDRAPHVESCTTAHNLDYTETTVVLSLNYDRAEFDPAAMAPLMEELTLRTKLEEEIL